jgi:hypothetical protein
VSAIEDTRKVLQDFLAPELRELKTRIEALENSMGERFNHAEKLEKERFDHVANRFEQIAGRFEQAERNAENRQVAILAEIKGLENYADLRERVAKLEVAKEALHQ